MDRIILSVADVDYILKWRDEHQDLIRRSECPKRAIRIEVIESRVTITAIRDGDDIKLQVNRNGISLGKIVFKHRGFGICTIQQNKTGLSEENVQACLTVYASCMAFLVYGSETHELSAKGQDAAPESESDPQSESRRRSGNSKPKKRSGCVYILHQSNGQIRAKGKHRSPKGVFGVRGHFRHYKSGKVVWIAEYTKGTGKKKNKVYKTGIAG